MITIILCILFGCIFFSGTFQNFSLCFVAALLVIVVFSDVLSLYEIYPLIKEDKPLLYYIIGIRGAILAIIILGIYKLSRVNIEREYSMALTLILMILLNFVISVEKLMKIKQDKRS